jgi:Sua5/YciO/YrdC/YwlC family protein
MKIFKQSEIEKISKCLKEGNIVSVPTETVYGLAVSLDNMKAISKLVNFKEKGNTPFTVMLADKNEIKKYGIVNDIAERIIDKYVPGELTIIYKKNPQFKNDYFNDYDTIGIIIPNNEFMIELLRKTGPILIPSANKKGEKPCLTHEEVVERLDIQYVVEGRCISNNPSTIISVASSEIVYLRKGNLEIDI